MTTATAQKTKKNVMRSKSPDQIVHGCCNGFDRRLRRGGEEKTCSVSNEIKMRCHLFQIELKHSAFSIILSSTAAKMCSFSIVAFHSCTNERSLLSCIRIDFIILIKCRECSLIGRRRQTFNCLFQFFVFPIRFVVGCYRLRCISFIRCGFMVMN